MTWCTCSGSMRVGKIDARSPERGHLRPELLHAPCDIGELDQIPVQRCTAGSGQMGRRRCDFTRLDALDKAVQICFGNPSEVAVSTGRRQVEPQDGGSRMGIGVMCWRISPGFPFNLFSLYFDLFFCCSARGIVCYVDWTRSMSRSEQAVWRIRGKPKPYGNHGLSDTGTEIF